MNEKTNLTLLSPVERRVAGPAAKKLAITVAAPYPLLDPGDYMAECTEATFAWAKQWKKWMARLVLVPRNYCGKPYQGNLCKFLNLGTSPTHPYAGAQSGFRKLWVEVNGDQPGSPEVTIEIFKGVIYDIVVETVTLDRNGKERRPEHQYSIVRDIHPTLLRTPVSGPSNP